MRAKIYRLARAGANLGEALARRLISPPPFSWRDASAAALAIPAAQNLSMQRLLSEIVPDDPLIQHRLGVALAGSGDDDAALAPLERAVSKDPGAVAHWDAWLRVCVRVRGAEATLAQCANLPPWPADCDTAIRRCFALALLTGKREDLAFANAGQAFGAACRGLAKAEDFSGIYSLRLRFADGGYWIQFSKDFLYWGFLVDRLLTLAPYLNRLAQEGVRGEARLSIGDGPDGPDRQICFSSADPTNALIPDPMFIESGGYAEMRAFLTRYGEGWLARKDQAYWRGALTGVADNYRDIMRLPRVDLALLGLHAPDINAKITDLSQFGPWLPNLQFMLEGLDVIGAREPITENTKYRYLIDVDGNSNSWPGLFNKLLVGGLVIKVRSPFRQWFYDRMDAEPRMILIDRVADLPEALAKARSMPGVCKRMSASAAAFARTMTPETEYRPFADGVKQALE